METQRPSEGANAGPIADSPPPPTYPRERARVASVREVESFVQRGDALLTRIADEARGVCGASVGMVSLLEEDHEWVVACLGTDADRIPRALSFCAHTILEADALVVEDASRDPRFAKNPVVNDVHHMRFYAGAPILDATGLPLGAVCVCDAQPRALSSKRLLALRHLGEVASAALEARLLLANGRAHHAPADEAKADRARLDALLLTLIEPRPAHSD